MQVLIQAYENWDGGKGEYHYKLIDHTNENDIHAQAREFATSLLEPYKNDIKHYAEYMAARGYDYDDVYHSTLLECSHYKLWMEHQAIMDKINDISNNYFVSDLHFNHLHRGKTHGELRGVTLFERTQFKDDIAAHDKYIMQQLRQWAERHEGSTLWCLGDFGDISYLYFIEELRYGYGIECKFIYGNHDKASDLPLFKEAFDEVSLNPVYIHPRIVLCHEPVWPPPIGTVIVHGHLHCMVLDHPQYLNANIHICNYIPLSSKRIMKVFNKLEKPDYRFLREPYARYLKMTQYKADAVYNRKTGKLDYEASVKLHNEKFPKHWVDPIPKHTFSW